MIFFKRITKPPKILEKVQRVLLPSNDLLKFILDSIDERFVLLSFINFHTLTSFSISHDNFAKIVIHMITQYDSCLQELLNLRHDKKEAFQLFKDQSKSGNKIATFYYQSLLKDLTQINHSKPIKEKSTHLLRRYSSYSNLKDNSNQF